MLAASAATFSLFSCINNDYDLSDIDTTVGVNANVTIPVQMDDITLHSVLDLEEGSQIKDFNGEYAVIEDGTFESDKIDIPSFVIKKPVVEPINDVINVKKHYDFEGATGNWEDLKGELDNVPLFSFDLSGTGETNIHFSTNDVDESIVSIDEISVGTKTADSVILTLVLRFKGIERYVKNFSVEGLTLQLPKGLQLKLDNDGEYDATTGTLEYKKHPLMSEGNKKEIHLELSGIKNIENILNLTTNAATGKQSFIFTGICKVIAGAAVVYGKNLNSNVSLSDLANIQKVDYNCTVAFNGDIDGKDFTGNIQYELEGIDIDPVSMKDIPDVLNQAGTTIALYNPQIYRV